MVLLRSGIPEQSVIGKVDCWLQCTCPWPAGQTLASWLASPADSPSGKRQVALRPQAHGSTCACVLCPVSCVLTQDTRAPPKATSHWPCPHPRVQDPADGIDDEIPGSVRADVEPLVLGGRPYEAHPAGGEGNALSLRDSTRRGGLKACCLQGARHPPIAGRRAGQWTTVTAAQRQQQGRRSKCPPPPPSPRPTAAACGFRGRPAAGQRTQALHPAIPSGTAPQPPVHPA